MRETIVTSRQGFGATPVNAVLPVMWILAGIAAGWGILNFTPVKVLAVALGSVCIALAAWKIEAALYVVGFFLVVLQEGDTTHGTVFSFLESLNRPNIPSLLEVLFAVLAVAFLVRHFTVPDKRYSFQDMKLPLALFFGLLFIALINGTIDGTDFIARKEDFKKFIFPVLMFVCAVNILDTRGKIIRLLKIMFWVMLAKTYLADFYYLRGMGFPYENSNVVFMESGDQTLLVTILVAGIALLAERKLWWKSYLFMLWGLAPMLFALIFSYRRNAMWGTLFSFCLLWFLSQRDTKVRLLKNFLAASLSALLILSVAPATGSISTADFLINRLTSVVDRDQSSNVAHMNEWKVTLEDTMQRPLFGLGLGSMHSPVPDFEVINQQTVHNALLMLWMKMGAFALLLFLWCLYRYCRLGVTEALRRRDPLLTGLFATVGLWMIAMNVGPSWFYYRETCLMAFVMAAVSRLAILGRQPQTASPEKCRKGTQYDAAQRKVR
ncbi:MAG: O-antigen ligase family protein [Oryzomonas sp.]|uniref:O-antigen ligase family protein n=1 Tax=Oryzomonas sp. TaxID=2855186 RepID=UPI00283DC146|nr:O-antigen ligase family protein [Oryzomonas sp.]MDR3579656.1 O-antigen ligase family protein [Oryzomonas sp.]